MFAGFSESSLSSWTFWLQCAGIAGALVVVLSLVGMHLVKSEISARTHRTAGGYPAAAVPVERAPSPAIAEKAPPAPAKPATPAAPPPREITEEQRRAFIAALDDAPKRPLQVVISGENDPETQAYADQIRVMLVLAGYNCGPAVTTNSTPLSAQGVLIIVRDPARAPTFAGAIQNAFKAIGVEALGAKDANFQSGQVVVFVGGGK
jgi:hypothetical protein